MKKVKNILGVMMVLIAMTTVNSCKDEAPVFEPAEKPNTDQVYFPNTNSATVKASSLANSFDVAIERAKIEDAITVSLTSTGGNGLYTIPATVMFNAGQAATTIKVTYDPEVVGFDNYNDITIKIGEEFKTPYGLAEYSFKVGIPAPWKSLGKGTIVDDYVSAFFGVANEAWEVEIQENELQPGFFRLVNPYGENYPNNEKGDWDDSKDYYFEIHAENPAAVYINVQQVGMDWGYGEFSFGSLAGLNIAKGETLDEQIAQGRTGTYENGIISFPPSTLLASMSDYKEGGLFLANENAAFKILMPGVVLADYSVDLTYLGRFTDTKDKNFAVADITLGEDVESAKVALVAGKDIDAAIAGILDGTIEAIDVETSGSVMFSCEINGEYSIVAISYAGEEAQEDTYDTFEFATGGGAVVVDPLATVAKKVKNSLKRISIKSNLKPLK